MRSRIYSVVNTGTRGDNSDYACVVARFDCSVFQPFINGGCANFLQYDYYTFDSVYYLLFSSFHANFAKLVKGGIAYDVSIRTQDYREIFKIKMDATTGQPLSKATERKAGPTAPMAPASGEQVVSATVALLPKLTAGPAVRKKDNDFLGVPILYEGHEIAKVRVDAITGTPLATGDQPGKGEAGGKAAKATEKPKLEIIPKKWVLPLGYMSGLLAIISAVYYSWKRSLFAPMRSVAIDAKGKAAAGLRRTLRWHEFFGLVALVAAGFHVPYTVLFFLVLFIHFLQKSEVFGD